MSFIALKFRFNLRTLGATVPKSSGKAVKPVDASSSCCRLRKSCFSVILEILLAERNKLRTSGWPMLAKSKPAESRFAPTARCFRADRHCSREQCSKPDIIFSAFLSRYNCSRFGQNVSKRSSVSTLFDNCKTCSVSHLLPESISEGKRDIEFPSISSA